MPARLVSIVLLIALLVPMLSLSQAPASTQPSKRSTQRDPFVATLKSDDPSYRRATFKVACRNDSGGLTFVTDFTLFRLDKPRVPADCLPKPIAVNFADDGSFALMIQKVYWNTATWQGANKPQDTEGPEAYLLFRRKGCPDKIVAFKESKVAQIITLECPCQSASAKQGTTGKG